MELNSIYKLIKPCKGWPVEDSDTIEEAATVILGSPYWTLPEDCYKVIDRNETYSLLAVYRHGRISMDKRYLVVTVNIEEFARLSNNECAL